MNDLNPPSDAEIMALDAAIRAEWDAIPCHVPYDEYIGKHPQKEQVIAAQRKHMRAAVTAYNSTIRAITGT